VEEIAGGITTKLKKVLGVIGSDLDSRFEAIRTRETTMGNFVADVVMAALNADAAFLNSGSFRSDQIHKAGPFTLEDLMNVFPIQDPCLLLEVPGRLFPSILENSVSCYPATEGRFLQLSGVRFDFNPGKPAGSRVVRDSIYVKNEPLDESRLYKVATSSYLRSGKVCVSVSVYLCPAERWT
jgi:5'-nucleotidase